MIETDREFHTEEIKQINELQEQFNIIAHDDTIQVSGYKGYPNDPNKKHKRDPSNNFKYQIGLSEKWYQYCYESNEIDGYYNKFNKLWLPNSTPKQEALNQGCLPVHFKRFDFGYNSCFLIGSQKVHLRFNDLYVDLQPRFRKALESVKELGEIGILNYTGSAQLGTKAYTEAMRKRIERGCYISRYDWNLHLPKKLGKKLMQSLKHLNQDPSNYPEPEQTIYLNGFSNSKDTKIIIYNTKYKNNSDVDNYKIEITLRTNALTTPRVIGKDPNGKAIKQNFRDPKKFQEQPEIQKALQSYLKAMLKKYVIEPSGLKKEICKALSISNQKDIYDYLTDTKHCLTTVLKDLNKDDIKTIMAEKQKAFIKPVRLYTTDKLPISDRMLQLLEANAV